MEQKTFKQGPSSHNLQAIINKENLPIVELLNPPDNLTLSQLEPDNSLNDALSVDCLIKIFSHLCIVDRISNRRVCKRWKLAVDLSWNSVKKLDFDEDTWGISVDIIVHVLSKKVLTNVLSHCGQFITHFTYSCISDRRIVTPRVLKKICKLCPNLKSVEIENIKQSVIRCLTKKCKNIEEFETTCMKKNCDKVLTKFFTKHKKLKRLTIIMSNHMTGKCLNSLPIDTIEEITLFFCVGVQTNYVDYAIKEAKNLRKLKYSLQNANSTVEIIGTKRKLTQLFLSDCKRTINENSFCGLLNLVNLQKLVLEHCWSLTDNMLIGISNYFKELREFAISECGEITDRGISTLSILTKLEYLEMISISNVTDNSISDLIHLKTLKCYDCIKIKDLGIMALIRNAKDLCELQLYECSNTEMAIELATAVKKRFKVTYVCEN